MGGGGVKNGQEATLTTLQTVMSISCVAKYQGCMIRNILPPFTWKSRDAQTSTFFGFFNLCHVFLFSVEWADKQTYNSGVSGTTELFHKPLRYLPSSRQSPRPMGRPEGQIRITGNLESLQNWSFDALLHSMNPKPSRSVLITINNSRISCRVGLATWNF